MTTHHDVIVIGGGAAGLSGALALTRARRSVLVVDDGTPRNARAGHVHNYLGREGTPPADLIAIGRDEVAGYGGRFLAATAVAASTLPGGGFEVTFADAEPRTARRLLVTTGLVDELPDVPGLADRWGREVLHCPYCHGWEVRDQPIAVLATGPFAAHQAQLFRQWTPRVSLLQHTGPDLTGEHREEMAALGVTVVPGVVTGLQIEADTLTGVELETGDVVATTALVVAPAFAARSTLLASLGVPAEPVQMGGHVLGTAIPTDATGATVLPGVWAAGNVTDPRAQVISSAEAGLRAGAAINGDLILADTREAVMRYRAAAAG